MEKKHSKVIHDEKQEGFGATLRRERLLRQISLEEVSEATKIRQSFLQALEEEKCEALPEEIFIRGFIMAYAEHIGIDGRQIVDRYIAQVAPPAVMDEEEEQVYPWVKRSSRVFLPSLVVVSVVLMSLIATLLWIGWPAFGEGSGRVKQNIDQPTLSVVLHPEEGSTSLTRDAPLADSVAEATSLRLTIKALERSYVRVYADGEERLDTLLLEGESRELLAKDRFSLTVGNAGGIRLFLNDRQIQSLGRRGEVQTMVIQPPFEGLFDE